MVRSCVSTSGVGDLVEIDGIMNAKNVLSDFDAPSGRHLIGNSFIFQTMIPNTLPIQENCIKRPTMERYHYGLASPESEAQH